MSQAKTPPQSYFLSLIVPAYKQEETIARNIRLILEASQELSCPYEVIVVVDGDVDKTAQQARRISSAKVKVVGYRKNHGKGYAVRFGMAKAKGNLIAFLDAGMDLDPKVLQEMLLLIEKDNADIIIGSKLHPKSKVVYPWQRKIMSWVYRKMVHILFGLSIRDTQVGVKIFRREVLEDVLPRLLVKKFAFDIEILAVAHYLGYKKIEEAPIKLRFNNWSSITSRNFWRPVVNMTWDTLAVFYRLKIVHYYDNKSKRKWKYDPELNFRVNVG